MSVVVGRVVRNESAIRMNSGRFCYGVRGEMEYRVTRVCGDGWFADVPTGCEWVGEERTSVEVQPPEAEASRRSAKERLELSGHVLVRGDANTIVSCGGLMVSLPSSTVGGGTDDVRVVFTREGLGVCA